MARRMSRFIQLAMGAGGEAVRDSGIDFAAMDQDQLDRVGVVVNTGGGGIEQIIDGTHIHDEKGPRFVSPFAVPALSGSMAACMLSMEYHLTGPVITQVAACATSVIAFHDALRLIRDGDCDIVLTGGSEAPIWPMGLAALSNMTALSKRNDDPATASRPFDADARRLRPRRGRRRRHRRVAGPRPGARRDPDRRDHRRGADRRRLPHQRPRPDGPRPDPGDDLGAAQRRRRARRDRLHRRPRHGHQPQRLDRDEGDQGRLRRPCLQGRHQLAEVDDRPPRRGGRDRVGAGRASGRSATRSSRRRRTCTRPTPSATSTTSRWSRARPRSRRSPSTASGSVARTR